MASNTNEKDIQLISNAVVDGDMDVNNLPQSVQVSLANYWGSAGLDVTQPYDETSQAQYQALRQERAAASGSFFDSPIFKPIEWVGSKLYAAWSATVSPILSAGGMALHSIAYGRPDYIGEDGEFDALKDYWDLAHKISPGQAAWMMGLSDKELENRGIRPDQIADDKDLVAKGDYKDTPTTEDPFGVRTKADEYFGSGASKYVTGATDFAVSWYLDPLVLGGKAAGATKRVAFNRPVTPALNKLSKKFGPDQAFNKFAEKPAFQSMVDTVVNVKRSSPDNAALVLRRDMPTLAKSANGDVLARLLTQAKDADEVSDILRVSLGDTAAKTSLEIRNVKIADQVNQLTSRNVLHGSYYDGLDDATKASPRGQKIKAALDQQTGFVTKLNNETRVIDDKIDAFRSLDAMNYNAITTPLGLKVRAGVQDGSFKAVRGQGTIRGTGALVYNATIGAPIKVIRSYNDIKPTNYIDVHGESSYRELDASLRETKSLSREAREMYVAQYVKATPNERQVALMQIEQKITRNMVDRYNVANPTKQIDYAIADDMYKEVAKRRSSGQASAAQTGRSYGSATMPDPANPARTIRVAEVDVDGSRLVSTPIFDTQLANSHVLLDFGLFEKALNANASKWQAAKLRHGQGWIAKSGDVVDFVNTTWKFAQLFRLGYAPRALADDFLGQLAKFGGVAMMGRAIGGGRITAEDMFHNVFKKSNVDAARIDASKAQQQISEYGALQASIKGDLLRAQAKGNAHDVARLQDDMVLVTQWLDRVKTEHVDYQRLSAAGQQMRDVKIGRQVFSPAFGGKQGELYRDLAAGDRNFKNMMGSQADFYLQRMRRLEWKNISPATDGAETHMAAWIRHANDQIGQSAVGRQALMGKSESEIAAWMRNTPEGQKYKNDIGLKHMPDLELAQRVKAQVDYVLDPAMPGMDSIRAAILGGTLEKGMLDVVPVANRPMVNAEAFRYAEGTSTVSHLLDRGITGWYNIANQIPARKLLRNPLFGSSYKNHLTDSMATMRAQGVTHIDESTRKILESNARKGALDDVKKYTFTMDHETKMAYMMRNFGAFFGAQQESWNRWSRIIADKPDVLARVGQAYGAPARAGVVTDGDGNAVDASGHVTDPVTGEKKLIKYADRRMVVQVPDYLGGKGLNKALGLDENASFVIPMSSAEIILNHGDGALPVGAGPFVQIGVNHFAQDDPKVADWAKKLGVLPFGPQESIMDFVNPTTGKRLGDATDDMGETKQRALFYSMQVENYKYENGLRETQPTWDELKDRADRWTIFRTAAAWTLPVSVNGQDPYQFFRDEFQRYQKLDPDTSDEKFYDKYGDSFYTFTQSMSKNNTGLRPTAESVTMSKYYQDLIEQVGPEYAGLIVGHEGDGTYSEGAYFYQKTHASDVASNVTQRTTMSAREAFEESQKSRGWMQYRTYMDNLNAQLFDRGLNTFDDEGAEDLKDTKQALVRVLTQQRYSDGGENPFYNEAWEKDFSSMDRGKYDRTAFDLEKIVQDPELWAKAVGADGTVGVRSDIYTLKTYLEYRKQMAVTLASRDSEGGSADITAQSNYDLKNSWDDMVMRLLESDTKFSWIHSRYFATDMGFSMDVKYTEEQQAAMAASDATVIGQQAVTQQDQPGMFDVMADNGV